MEGPAVLWRAARGRRRLALSLSDEKTDPKAFVARSDDAKRTWIWFFQIVMALALTNGVRIFLTGSGTVLHPAAFYTTTEAGIFVLFVTSLTLFSSTATRYFHRVYSLESGGFIGKRLRPALDFVLLFFQSGIFFALSNTIAQANSSPTTFFQYLTAFRIVDVAWCAIIIAAESQPRKVSAFALVNGGVSLIVIMLLESGTGSVPSHAVLVVIFLVLTLRNVFDVVVSYTHTSSPVFPGLPRRLRSD